MIMKKSGSQILSIITATLTLVVVAAPVLAKDLKAGRQSSSPASAEAAAQALGGMSETDSSSTVLQHNRKAGPAWRTIGGTLKQIKGDTYLVEDYEGNQVQLHVGHETKHLRQKRVGDTVRAEITRSGFTNSIQ